MIFIVLANSFASLKKLFNHRDYQLNQPFKVGFASKLLKKRLNSGLILILCIVSLAASVLVLLSTSFAGSVVGEMHEFPKLGAFSLYLQGKQNRSEASIAVSQQHLNDSNDITSNVSKDDAQIALFFSKKYHLSAKELGKYVHFARIAATEKRLDPTLVMAVMSIESNFNPITESSAGAQGLMQVLTAAHLDKLAKYGGANKVFDPEVNIVVGTTILADCIKLGGGLEMGLKCYVGATGPTDGGYGVKVLAERDRIEKARLGVFDFSPNNKILQDMGLLAAPKVSELNGLNSENTSSLDALLNTSNQLNNLNTGNHIPALAIPALSVSPPNPSPLNHISPSTTVVNPGVEAHASQLTKQK